MEETFNTTDTIFHLTQIIIDIRNRKRSNVENIEYEPGKFLGQNYFISIYSEEVPGININIYISKKDIFEAHVVGLNSKDIPKYRRAKLKEYGWIFPYKGKPTIPIHWKKFNVADINLCYTTATELILAMMVLVGYKPELPLKISYGEADTFQPLSKLTSTQWLRNIISDLFFSLADKIRVRGELDEY